MALSVAYTAAGRLYLKEADKPGRELVSRFGEKVVSRALKESERDSWKFSAKRTNPLFGGKMLWSGRDPNELALVPPRITGVARTPDRASLFYVLQTDMVGGLFFYDRDQDSERRLFHKEGWHARDPDFNAEVGLMAFSLPLPNGVSSISISDSEGRGLERITEGDSVDEAPSWLPNVPKTLVYQSAGIGRTHKGLPVGLGPCSLHKIDVGTRRAETLLEDRRFDYLQPRGMANGDLLFIRRPYEHLFRRRISPWTLLKDIVLFPFRVIKSIFHFLNAFALAFSQKPLTTAGGPRVNSPEIHELYIRGRAVDARRAMMDPKQGEEPPSLVPSSWELVRRAPNGAEKTLANGVVSFDVGRNGTVAYTTGSAIYVLDKSGTPRRIEKGSLIEQVVLLEEEE